MEQRLRRNHRARCSHDSKLRWTSRGSSTNGAAPTRRISTLPRGHKHRRHCLGSLFVNIGSWPCPAHAGMAMRRPFSEWLVMQPERQNHRATSTAATTGQVDHGRSGTTGWSGAELGNRSPLLDVECFGRAAADLFFALRGLWASERKRKWETP